MIINEKALIGAMKREIKSEGYSIYVTNGYMHIFAENWMVRSHVRMMPKKILATVVEHIGVLPAEGRAITITREKNGDINEQVLLPESATHVVGQWFTSNGEDAAVRLPLTVLGQAVYQTKDLKCYTIPESLLTIANLDLYPIFANVQILDEEKAMYEFEEMYVIVKVRRANTQLATEWEQKLWTALEKVDLQNQ